jgi:outer membrane protein, heavy metal efflux system
VCALWVPGTLCAQTAPTSTVTLTPENPAPAQRLTLEQALAMAEQHSPQLQGAGAAVAQASAGVATSRVYTNPQIEVFEGRQYARPVPTPGVPGLLQHYAAYQTIELPSERRSRLRTAEHSATAAGFALAGVTRSVRADVKHAFYTVLRLREEVEHTQETLSLTEDLRKRVQVEVDVGEKGRLELTRAEAEVARARFAVQGARLELASGIAQLRVVTAAPADLPLDPDGSFEPRVSLPPLPQLRDQVLRTHPALAESEENRRAAEANLQHERSLRVPQPTAFAEFEDQPDLRFWRAGVTVSVPLWDQRKGRIQAAQAVITQQQAALTARRLELLGATERAFAAYQLADQQAQSLQSGELHAAESAVTAAQAAYRFGERGILEVLDAQRVLQGVRDDLLNAQFARQNALVDLEELGAVAPGAQP